MAKHTNRILFGALLIFCFHTTQVWASQTHRLQGKILDPKGEPVPFAAVLIPSQDLSAITDMEGRFEIQGLTPGRYAIRVQCVGFERLTQDFQFTGQPGEVITFRLTEYVKQLNEVTVRTELTEVETIERTGFSVDVLDLGDLSVQSVDVNSLLGRMSGVQVKRSGGMGSDFTYTLDGMSGNAIRFLIDGIPTDYFGSVYNINNLPVSLISRIDVYKGVVPVELAADALGGAINIITTHQSSDFLEASYSIGSFNTHQASITGQWNDQATGFTTWLSAFYNASDNDYQVWGPTVTYFDESTNYRPVEYTKENPATRFNDDYRAGLVKLDVGLMNKPWADQLFVGFLASDVDQGVQHGQTMAYVYGDMRYTERFYMPTFTYAKDHFLLENLSLKAFSSYAVTSSIATDTSAANYNWSGEVISTNGAGGERRSEKSLFYLDDRAWITSVNSGYQINDQFKVVLNFLYKDVNRQGHDDFAPYHTAPFTEPQYLKTSFTGLSFNSNLLDQKLKTEVFGKYYGYNALVTEEYYAIDSDERVREVISQQGEFGGGVATSFNTDRKFLLKFSVERAIRLPTTREALGDGVNVLNSPNLGPENSINVNLGASLGKYFFGTYNSIRVNVNTFYRDTRDLIWPVLAGGRGEIRFENFTQILSKGVEFEAQYDYDSKVELSYNLTYLDQRNNAEFEEGVRNIVYGDRLKNAPFLMSNAGLNVKWDHLIQQNSSSFLYCQAGYIHEYFLAWPSLGDPESKSTIPSQFSLDVGYSYTFPKRTLSLAVDVSNVLNAQLYDNFLLQKPGRAFALKVSYRITNNN